MDEDYAQRKVRKQYYSCLNYSKTHVMESTLRSHHDGQRYKPATRGTCSRHMQAKTQDKNCAAKRAQPKPPPIAYSKYKMRHTAVQPSRQSMERATRAELRCAYRAHDRRSPSPPLKQRVHYSDYKHKQEVSPRIPRVAAGCSHTRKEANAPPSPWALGQAPRQTTDPKAAGDVIDCVLYRNKNFGKEQNSDGLLDDPMEHDMTYRINRFKHMKSPSLESARERCRKMNEHFAAKYAKKDLLITDTESMNSKKTARSIKTVISTRNVDALRGMVRSQVQLQEILHRSIDRANELKDKLDKKPCTKVDLPSLGLSEMSACYSTTRSKKQPVAKHSDMGKPQTVASCGTISIANDSLLHGKPEANGSHFSFSVEDVVNSRVITPMIRRIQRMYLNNLQEEMALMEELERVPSLVSEVYKSADQQGLLMEK
ncbi:uncharacterized protein LOC108594512 [Drosophila busckii]|uniref:uncharacterized protein LOC108594512 n=1 Tax=Drosophila busckii TaxID=30019 RepID=UPI00083EEDF7|nr:uncharacterized protein LOC108594512 [Drosophila busckii]